MCVVNALWISQDWAKKKTKGGKTQSILPIDFWKLKK